mgnify:FL=1
MHIDDDFWQRVFDRCGQVLVVRVVEVDDDFFDTLGVFDRPVEEHLHREVKRPDNRTTLDEVVLVVVRMRHALQHNRHLIDQVRIIVQRPQRNRIVGCEERENLLHDLHPVLLELH